MTEVHTEDQVGRLKNIIVKINQLSNCSNPIQHDPSKHIEKDHHFIKEKLDSGLICSPFVPTRDQLADVHMQELTSVIFQSSITKLRMEDIHSPT